MSKARGGDQEELPNVLRRLGAAAETNYRMPEVQAAAWRSYPMPEVRGGGPEEQPHVQGAGKGGLRGATPRSRSGGAAVRRYPLSKVRSSSCALLEQP